MIVLTLACFNSEYLFQSSWLILVSSASKYIKLRMFFFQDNRIQNLVTFRTLCTYILVLFGDAFTDMWSFAVDLSVMLKFGVAV